ncbi:hypothetical protein Q3G72_009577 [Acer saccharum]|nr:hypothetical protein Q3G72_009577 [Acer saccharum]
MMKASSDADFYDYSVTLVNKGIDREYVKISNMLPLLLCHDNEHLACCNSTEALSLMIQPVLMILLLVIPKLDHGSCRTVAYGAASSVIRTLVCDQTEPHR